MDELRVALKESLLLQTHYASLLNQYDGGNRMSFYTVDQWLDRLREVGKLSPNKPVEPPLENQSICKACGVEHEGIRCPKI